MANLFLPEAGSNILKLAILVLAIQALVGGWFLQGTQVPDERADLDVVEVLFVDGRGDDRLAAIPGDFELGVGQCPPRDNGYDTRDSDTGN